MTDFQGKTCVVTGGAGFVGSHVVDHLIDRGANVIVIDDLSEGLEENIHPDAKFINKDLNDLQPEDIKGVQVIYHLAAHPAEGLSVFVPYHNTFNNYLASIRVMTMAIEHNVETIVFTSSIAAYGKNPKPPFREDDPLDPVDVYGIGKADVERILRLYGNEFGFNYVIIRPYNIYGIRQDLRSPYRNVLALFINRLMMGLPPIIFGDGRQQRAFTHVSDVAPVIARAGFDSRCHGQIINLGSDRPVTVNEIAKLVLKAFGSNLEPVHHPYRPFEIEIAYSDITRARQLLDFDPKADLEQEIQNMVAWAKEKGPQEFRYHDISTFEITKNIPKAWQRDNT
jgi:UDP-glucose 4-epimerase